MADTLKTSLSLEKNRKSNLLTLNGIHQKVKDDQVPDVLALTGSQSTSDCASAAFDHPTGKLHTTLTTFAVTPAAHLSHR